MIVDCAHYLKGGGSTRARWISRARPRSACDGDGGFVWLGIVEPDADELA